MNEQNYKVLAKIIGAVETGGQVYGNARYDDYTAPYTNTPGEHTITLGWPQFYGDEAKRLIQLILEKDESEFRRIDTGGLIEKRLKTDWVITRWNPSAKEKRILINLIDSDAGHEAQDELFTELMKSFVADCDYTTDDKAVMMYCEIRHLGGKGAADRIFRRCNNYSLSAILTSLRLDQSDKTSSNQVGDSIFWSRHQKCAEFIEKYAVCLSEESQKTRTNTKAVANADTKGEQTMTPLQRAKKLLRQPQSDTMTGYTPDGKQCFVDAGAFYHTPQPGDIIYFYSTAKGRIGHVGIVEKVDASSKTVHTIEGNTSSTSYAENGGCVARHSYSYASQGGTNRVNGFGRPDFKGAGVTAEQFVAMAISYLGYLEKRSNADLDSKTANAGSNNYQRFQRDVGAGNGDQWCQYFVDAMALYCCQSSAQTDEDTGDKVKEGVLHEDPKWYAYITTDLMNVRTWAGKEHSTVSFSPLPFRTKLGICDEVKAANGDKWYYILYKGKHGFVSAKYISKKKPKRMVKS